MEGSAASKMTMIQGEVVVMKKNVLDFKDVMASVLDRVHELLGRRVTLQLVSSVQPDPGNERRGRLGKAAHLANWVKIKSAVTAEETAFAVAFEWDESMGTPSAFVIKNHHRSQFFLKSLTLRDVPGASGSIHFVCNSWIYPSHRYGYDRVFFSNQAYLPNEMPELLKEIREEELMNLRGNGKGERKEWDRVYDYDVFNDLGSPDKVQQSFLDQTLRDSFGILLESRSAWRADEEFGREMIAGLNPLVIRRLQEFPPLSKLDPDVYGNQHSSIREDDVEPNMNGLTIDEALKQNKLYVLDYHDSLMPYLRRMNSTGAKLYATRTVLLLKDDGILMPLAIELSLPHPQGEKYGAVSKIFTPAAKGVEASIWQLAKAYVAINDSGFHQLISHWLHTHATMEPFIISANRQLSVIHPIYKLLHPHFRDTMQINALARHILINADGVLERTVFPGKYSMEWSSSLYRNWVFTDQALPADLLKRGVAVLDPSCDGGVRLLIEDYPYAVDGLEIWSAIETWVTEYCSYYYKTDKTIQTDIELQSWWSELRNVGHGDKKHEPWWPKMQSRSELIQTCSIIIWIASALHATVNFGQYPYAGFLPNRPTVSRRFMPESGTKEYEELKKDPDVAYLKTITPQLQTLLGISIIEVLSMHSTDELYLGQRESPNWTADDEVLAMSRRFTERLEQIENNIVRRNNIKSLKNRLGPVKMPYTLLYPNTSDYTREGGMTGKGIPNSISV
ncbi:PREDICTED: linoleate 9S-lipoxygenase 5, chloroplastic-like [Tarenaya hassleriana]|uniref:linoleate 9S-lipoxygenase 5, chloroplastic-like n=1 Tax=Tarenaya hassleriana TaxID=28532 RepID=UPI00053C53B4|nr:PREDICTED: linoleate 9S-lipoxygenase 5, chloroplastic-like [Tarenaya hassleriana]